ncbi:MAG: elongation factor P [Candidatus Eisenbacteria bacterium]|nr:elongation factor P [Candidatus Eisenbacteria bacterium]
MATSNDFHNGMVLRRDGKLFVIVEFLHVKPGKGGAFVRSKLKEIRTGRVLDVTWRAGEKVEDVRVERAKAQFLYHDGFYHFMNHGTFEQHSLSIDVVGAENAPFLKDGMDVEMLLDGSEPVLVELPTFVDLRIKHTEPGVKGDTVSGSTKPATLETGAVIQVPLFVQEGDTVRVDTRTGAYVSRV